MNSARTLSWSAAVGILLAVAVAGAQERETYTWVDSAGMRHYSDRPPPSDARQVRTLQVPLPRSSQAPAAPATSTTRQFEPEDGDEDAAVTPTITVVRPTADESFVNTAGLVQVAVNVEPQMPDQGRVNIYLDGAVVATGVPGQQSFQLSPVYRGAHSVSAVLVDGSGSQVSRSNNVTFYVRQQSLLRAP
ncbi:MAG: DUF4124 domain-containing protein [Pseudomonadota bacterium]